MVDGGAIGWCSCKQNVVTTSKREAEYIISSAVGEETVSPRRFLVGFVQGSGSGITIFSGSQSSIRAAENKEIRRRSKHNDITVHVVRDVTSHRETRLKLNSMAEMVVGRQTKLLRQELFNNTKKVAGLQRKAGHGPK